MGILIACFCLTVTFLFESVWFFVNDCIFGNKYLQLFCKYLINLCQLQHRLVVTNPKSIYGYVMFRLYALLILNLRMLGWRFRSGVEKINRLLGRGTNLSSFLSTPACLWKKIKQKRQPENYSAVMNFCVLRIAMSVGDWFPGCRPLSAGKLKKRSGNDSSTGNFTSQ